MGYWLGLRALKILYFYYKKLRYDLKQFLQRILQEIMKKNNTWNIRRLDPATQRIMLKIVGFQLAI